MTSTTKNNGRYGNQLIRNIAVSLIAEKFNLNVRYSSTEDTTKLGIHLFSGEKIYDQSIILNNENYFEILNSTNNSYTLDPAASAELIAKGWEKEAIPIVLTKKSIISRIFSSFFN